MTCTSPINITVECGFNSIKVKFGNDLHLFFMRTEFLGLQSWFYGRKTQCIEITLKGGVILCEYDDIEKFKTILAGLESLL